MNVIAGNISAAGSAAVGAAGGVPIVTKTTHAFIGDDAHVTRWRGNGALGRHRRVHHHAGRPALRPVDSGPAHGRHRLPSRPEPRRELPRGRAGPLRQRRQPEHRRPLQRRGLGHENQVYYVHIVSPTTIQLLSAPGGFTAGSGALGCSGVVVCGLTAPSAANRGESHRFVPTDQARRPRGHLAALRPANGIDVNTGTDTITLPYTIGIGDRRPGGLQLRRRPGDRRPRRRPDLLREERRNSAPHATQLQLAATKGGAAIDLTSTAHRQVAQHRPRRRHAVRRRERDRPARDHAEDDVGRAASRSRPRTATTSRSSASAPASPAARPSNLSGAVAVVTANTSAYVGKSTPSIDSAWRRQASRPATSTTSSASPRRSRSAARRASASASASAS